ncbi:MAG: ankyrin repeat domain-containing protein [Limnohabitans sp.]|nr:ankyrin repeat domain-containing protein [Limnohabitans sp.]
MFPYKKVFQFIVCINLLISNFLFSQNGNDIFEISRKGTVKEMGAIIEKIGKDKINAVNDKGYTPLILSCYNGNEEVALWLIKNKCDVNYKSVMGTALMAAVVKGKTSLVNLLLSNEADPNITDSNNATALHLATMFKNYDVMRSLIKAKNINLEVKDSRGKTAFDYAIMLNDDALIEILKSKK